jgi:hypothetical protein
MMIVSKRMRDHEQNLAPPAERQCRYSPATQAFRHREADYFEDKMKTCRCCQIEKPKEMFCTNRSLSDAINRICRECAAQKSRAWKQKNHKKHCQYMSKWNRSEHGRISQESYREKARQKARAHNFVLWLKRKVGLVLGPCIICSSTNRIEAHHPDYLRPDYFFSLCKACHRRHHRKFWL